MTKPHIEHKTLAFTKASISDSGELSGYGAWFNNLDDGGDIIEPGFFADVLDDFLKEGFYAWGHDWDDPVAMPTGAKEDAVGLAINGIFHSTPGAQEKRVITKERLDAGLTMGLSIGYEIAPGGAKRAADGSRHLLKAKRLYEVSLVMVPMNREATVANVKSADLKAAADNVSDAVWCLTTLNRLIESEAIDAAAAEGDATDDAADVNVLTQARDWLLAFIESESSEVGTPADLEQVAAEAAAWAERYWGYGYMGRTIPFADHLSTVTTAVKAAAARAHAVARLRKEGRVLSSANHTRLEGLLKDLAAVEADIKDLLASGEPVKSVPMGVIDLEYELTRARLSGVPI